VKMEKVHISKIEVEKFNDKNNFELQKPNMWDLLVQQGLKNALLCKKLTSMIEEE
jgi:hypothetical protein